jgi:hypothetical protein
MLLWMSISVNHQVFFLYKKIMNTYINLYKLILCSKLDIKIFLKFSSIHNYFHNHHYCNE